jgi:hypothetical protein
MTTDREKELGIQTTLEEVLKKESKQGKHQGPHSRGTTSQPSKGGIPKNVSK